MQAKNYLNQDYNQIKRECLRSGNLFVDEEFPPNHMSITKVNVPVYVENWLRPKDLVSEPQFFVNGPNPNDLDQGSCGDCWFIAGAVAVSQYTEYFNYMVPQDQSFHEGDYCGAFHFRFWRYGEWLDVVIDDFLPVDGYNRLVYCRNKSDPNEFWCSLLEKAYAKLNTCYEFLDGGLTADALVDMTGGVEEAIEIDVLNQNGLNSLWRSLKQTYKMKSLGAASIIPENRDDVTSTREMMLDNGLYATHAYAITKVVEIGPTLNVFDLLTSFIGSSSVSFDSIRLVRLRNPWGGDYEWNGRFSDSSPEWSKIPESVKKDIGLVIADDGEFWMPYEDFVKNFNLITFVHVDMNSFYDPEFPYKKNLKWHSESFHGRLERNDQRISESNPQYVIQIDDADKDDDDDKATLIVSLTQKDGIKRRCQNFGQYDEMPIQFSIYKLLLNDEKRLDQSMKSHSKFNLNKLKKIADSGAYSPTRTISKRFKLPPGNYVIIPSSYYDVEINFLLRIFTEFEIGNEDLSCLDKEPSVDSSSDFNNQDFNEQNYDGSDSFGGTYSNYGENFKNNNRSQIYDDIISDYAKNNYDSYDNSYGLGADYESFDDSNLYKIDYAGKREFSKGDSSNSQIANVNFDCKNSSTKDKCNVM